MYRHSRPRHSPGQRTPSRKYFFLHELVTIAGIVSNKLDISSLTQLTRKSRHHCLFASSNHASPNPCTINPLPEITPATTTRLREKFENYPSSPALPHSRGLLQNSHSSQRTNIPTKGPRHPCSSVLYRNSRGLRRHRTRRQNRNAQRHVPSHHQSRRSHRNSLRRTLAHRQIRYAGLRRQNFLRSSRHLWQNLALPCSSHRDHEFPRLRRKRCPTQRSGCFHQRRSAHHQRQVAQQGRHLFRNLRHSYR